MPGAPDDSADESSRLFEFLPYDMTPLTGLSPTGTW